MADDRCGLHAPGFPEFCEAHLHGKNRGLRDLGALHLRGVFRARKFLSQREFRERQHRLFTGLDGGPEDRLVAHEFATHPPPLRALAAHDEGHARRLLGPWSEGCAQLRPGVFQRVCPEFLDHFRDRAGSQREAVRVVVPAGTEHVS